MHSCRYIGSLVGDFHRTLLYGGIYGYPGDSKNPTGKLRLLYECAPMSLIVEQVEALLPVQPPLRIPFPCEVMSGTVSPARCLQPPIVR